MRFVKMQGAGNDYIYVDTFTQDIPGDLPALSVKMSRPHFGVGSDGLIVIGPSDAADASMRVFNSDGSEAMMCGNGIRCVGKYLYDSGIAKKPSLSIDTLSGVKRVELVFDGMNVVGARVSMGRPSFLVREIPVVSETQEVVERAVSAAGHVFSLTAVSMGNPHAVIFVEGLPDDPLFFAAGAELESHPMFPNRANVEFAALREDGAIDVRVFERGSGETLACGTGACAVLAAAVRTGRAKRATKIHLRGGELFIEWNEQDGEIYMTGPAHTVFSGVYGEG